LRWAFRPVRTLDPRLRLTLRERGFVARSAALSSGTLRRPLALTQRLTHRLAWLLPLARFETQRLLSPLQYTLGPCR